MNMEHYWHTEWFLSYLAVYLFFGFVSAKGKSSKFHRIATSIR